MSSENTSETERSGTASRWSDLCPDLLCSICAKLPCLIDVADFGSVCKNWREVFSAANGGRACRVSHNANFTISSFRIGSTKTRYRNRIPDEIREDFVAASVVGRDESRGGRGWWLLSNSGGEIFCCFNPLPSSGSGKKIIPLPRLSGSNNNRSVHWIRTRAALSAPPTDPNSMILVVHGDDCRTTFSTHLRRQDWWATYKIRFNNGRICAGVGYNGGKFWCLFDTGEVLIFEFAGGGDAVDRRRKVSLMGGAACPLAPERFRGINCLQAAVKSDAGFEVVSWERVQGGSGGSFRLLAVEKETTVVAAAADELEVATLSLEFGARPG